MQVILDVVDKYSSRALRVLVIATSTFTELPFDQADKKISMDQKFEACHKSLCLAGLVASIDPDRDGVPDSVVAARGAGILVVMITGEYLETAIAIAHNVSILQSEDNEASAAVDCARLRPDGAYLSPRWTPSQRASASLHVASQRISLKSSSPCNSRRRSRR